MNDYEVRLVHHTPRHRDNNAINYTPRHPINTGNIRMYEGITIACDTIPSRTHHLCGGCQCSCHAERLSDSEPILSRSGMVSRLCDASSPLFDPYHYAEAHGRHRPGWDSSRCVRIKGWIVEDVGGDS